MDDENGGVTLLVSTLIMANYGTRRGCPESCRVELSLLSAEQSLELVPRIRQWERNLGREPNSESRVSNRYS